jgi:hypothetical protein
MPAGYYFDHCIALEQRFEEAQAYDEKRSSVLPKP